MKHRLVTAPATEPVSSTEAKLHCRVDGSDEDAWFTTAIQAARRWCENLCERAFITQTWALYLDGFPDASDDDGKILLPRPNLLSVTSIVYKDTAGASQTLSAALYQVDDKSEPGVVMPAPDEEWPETEDGRLNAVTVTYTAGYGAAASDVDPLAVQAIKILVGHWYENRETTVVGAVSAEMERAMRQLLAPLWHGRLS